MIKLRHNTMKSHMSLLLSSVTPIIIIHEKKYTADNTNLLLHTNYIYKKNKNVVITDKY